MEDIQEAMKTFDRLTMRQRAVVVSLYLEKLAGYLSNVGPTAEALMKSASFVGQLHTRQEGK